MKFRTEVEIPHSDKKINPTDALFCIGSCFATEMAERLAQWQLQTLCNPFGTIFNPHAVNTAIAHISTGKTYTEEDLVLYQDEYLSLHHHTSFSSDNAEKTLAKINDNIVAARAFLQQAKWVLITYGTAYVYEFLPQNILVANCHKIPQKFFKKRLLSHEELVFAMTQTIQNLHKINDKLQILFTLSPVRHTKDGFVENQLSKAKVLTAMHEAIEQNENCHYLPIYEIMIDDLRDYRFYKEDLIHPTPQAVQYIWEKFGDAYFSAEARDFIQENIKIKQALEHRPKDVNSPKHQEFLTHIRERIAQQQEKVSHPIFKESSSI